MIPSKAFFPLLSLLLLSVVTLPAHGSPSDVPALTGGGLSTPNAAVSGSGSVTGHVHDSRGESAPAPHALSLSQGNRDFNGDGRADILWRHASGALYIWFLDGTSIIGAGLLGGATNDWVIDGVGDFNGDGRADILWRHSSGALYVWLLDGLRVIGAGSLGGATNDWQIQ
jgi:hypothetical protein